MGSNNVRSANVHKCDSAHHGRVPLYRLVTRDSSRSGVIAYTWVSACVAYSLIG